MVSDFDRNEGGEGLETRLEEELKRGGIGAWPPTPPVRIGVVDGHVQTHLHLPAYDGAFGSGLTGVGVSGWWVW